MQKVGIVIGASPSLQEFNQLKTLADSDFKGYILACDRILEECLKHGIYPHYVFTIEDLKAIETYFPEKKESSFSWMRVIHSPRTRKEVIDVIEKRGYNVDLWDWKYLSLTPNVALMAFCFAWQILHIKSIALIGMQTGIDKPNIPSFPENSKAYEMYYDKIWNPEYEEYTYLVKAIHGHWRETFLDFLELCPEDVLIWNCSEKGSLFHERIITIPLEDFLGNS